MIFKKEEEEEAVFVATLISQITSGLTAIWIIVLDVRFLF